MKRGRSLYYRVLTSIAIEMAMVVNTVHEKVLTRLLPDNVDHRISIIIQILICLFAFAFILWIKTPREAKQFLIFLGWYLVLVPPKAISKASKEGTCMDQECSHTISTIASASPFRSSSVYSHSPSLRGLRHRGRQRAHYSI